MKKRISVFLAVLLALTLLAGCGASSRTGLNETSYVSSSSSAAVSPDSASDASGAQASAGSFGSTVLAAENKTATTPSTGDGSSAGSLPTDDRKVILNADLSLESKEFDTCLSGLRDRITALGGYISGQQSQNYTSGRWSQLTARVPSDKFDTLLEAAGELGNVVSLSQTSQDVTDSYIQTQSYIDSLTIQQDRLLELMKNAETLQDILDIEDRLATVRADLEYYTNAKNTYDSLISYATVNITLQEVLSYTLTEPTFGERLAQQLRSSWESFVAFLQNLLFFLISAAPYIVILAVIIFLIVRIRRKKGAHPVGHLKKEAPDAPPAAPDAPAEKRP